MVFWSLNERFMPNRTGDIFRVCRDASDNNKVFYATDSSSCATRQNSSYTCSLCRYKTDAHLMLDGPIDLPTNCRAATVTHVRFLKRNICHTKRISDSREKRETSREKRDPSREKRDERW